MSLPIHDIKQQFARRFGHAPDVVVRAPGRVNIIGEHTDYNQGFVLPMAIEHETVIAAKRRPGHRLYAFAANLDRYVETDLDHRARNADEPWIDYVVGVADELAVIDLPLAGAELLIAGDVPIACGLSSSASLEMAALCMFEALGGFRVEGAEAPRLGQRVENRFLGLSSGIMDQFISRMGRKGHALFLDCRSYVYELVPVAFASATFVIANTGVARGLTSSKYNERVAQCREAVEGMAKTLGRSGSHLRDFDLDDLTACRSALSDTVFRRARHVISENARTQAACAALRAGDAAMLGDLMNASDASLRDDYEVTCPELDAMTAIARGLPGCHGARMTGAGFGGCTISLVETRAAPAFRERLLADYRQRTGLRGETFLSAPADGASRVE